MSRTGLAVPFAAPAPAEAFARLAGRRGVCWLDSSLPRAGDGRYSILGCEPRWTFTARGAAWRLDFVGGGGESGGVAPLVRLEMLLKAHAVTPAAGIDLPFWGGAVGWLAYDLGRQFERIDGTALDDLAVPDLQFAWFDAAAVWDHHEGGAWLVGADGDRSAAAAVAELAGCLQAAPAGALPAGGPPAGGRATSDSSRAEYVARVAAVQAGIARGEYYQLNLVQRFECAQREPAAATYLRLRALNPAPFAAFIQAGEWAVLSSSPERFLEVGPDGRVRTCPIKGTRPRGSTRAEDAALGAELLASEKERAELLMIVDLLRNDLGRVCEFGSVAVPRLHMLESFATVHHLVGEVTGRLRPGVTLEELLRAVFPGGSITGAPKVSAMRAIDRLEPHRRGLGMGAMGYASAHGRLDFNIAIRTILCRGGRAYWALGAGIVADSVPEAEFEETLAKGRALFAALGVRPGDGLTMIVNGEFGPAPADGMTELPEAAGVFETVLIREGTRVFFAEHWARFVAGCHGHGFSAPVTPEEIANLTRRLAEENQVGTGVLRFAAWRHDTRIEWRLEVSPPRPHMAKAAFRVADGGPVLPRAIQECAGKQLRRGAGSRALRDARAAGWDEVLLGDPDGRLVEGGGANVFFVSGGVLLTPALAVGALPGVMRAQVLALVRAAGWPVREGEFAVGELSQASEIWLTNSLIGVRPVAAFKGRQFDPAYPMLHRLRAVWREAYGWDPLIIVSPES